MLQNTTLNSLPVVYLTSAKIFSARFSRATHCTIPKKAFIAPNSSDDTTNLSIGTVADKLIFLILTSLIISLFFIATNTFAGSAKSILSVSISPENNSYLNKNIFTAGLFSPQAMTRAEKPIGAKSNTQIKIKKDMLYMPLLSKFIYFLCIIKRFVYFAVCGSSLFPTIF
ncbi:MAG TPA: hypothetical protein H9690_06210 [Firmicutes bacterium]|nr:hypothetical protein [Bacillota bacterium]